MPTLSIPAAPPGAAGSSAANGGADLGTISVHVLLHPEPFLARGDGQRAVEHPIHCWPEPMVECPRKAQREVRCYIEVEQNNYFAFEFSISNRSVVTADGLKFAIFLDDHYVDYAFMERDDCEDPPFVDEASGEPVAWKRGVARCGRSTKKAWYEHSFYFKPISFVKHVTDLGMAMRQEKRAAGMGNLRIEVYRLVKNKRALERSEVSENSTEYNDHFLMENLAIHRDFLHNRSATLSATLAGRMPSLQIDVGREFGHIDGALRPMAVFNFEYRTREILRTLGYKPPANVPAPIAAAPTTKRLVDREINSLSDKEKAQLIRQLKEAVATSGSIFSKGAKVSYVPQNLPKTKKKRKRETSPSGDGSAQINPRVEVKTQCSNGAGLTIREKVQENKKEPTQKGKEGEKQKGKQREQQKSKKGQTQSLLHDAPSAPKRMRMEQAKANGRGGRR